MKILYYCWDEITSNDILDLFKRKGYSVDCLKYPIVDKLNDISFMEVLSDRLRNNSYDFIFTFNFFPVISKVADGFAIKYVSWIFDSPHITLYTESAFNSCNYIFAMDRVEAMCLKKYGIENVYSMPLAVNTDKLKKILPELVGDTDYKYELSFMGNLYNNQYNFYDQIKGMPEYYRGFFDGIMNSQMNIYGYDIASDLITKDFKDILNSFVKFNLDEEFFISDIDMFVQILQKKITVIERPAILKMLSETGIAVTHFAPEADKSLNKVCFKGYLDYDTEMPLVFRKSKINLNISLRTILSGIPLRCLDIMGAGGFLLSNYQPELAELFEAGVEMVMYDSRADLLDKAKYYLKHDEERIRIAEKGRAKIENEFSYDIIWGKIMEIVGKSI